MQNLEELLVGISCMKCANGGKQVVLAIRSISVYNAYD